MNRFIMQHLVMHQDLEIFAADDKNLPHHCSGTQGIPQAVADTPELWRAMCRWGSYRLDVQSSMCQFVESWWNGSIILKVPNTATLADVHDVHGFPLVVWSEQYIWTDSKAPRKSFPLVVLDVSLWIITTHGNIDRLVQPILVVATLGHSSSVNSLFTNTKRKKIVNNSIMISS